MAVNIVWNRRQIKEEKMEYDPEKPLGIQMMDYVHHLQEEGNRGESKEEYEKRIFAKVRSGKPLTPAEMNYLARTNPEMYRKALRAQAMRKALENRLKSCKSKQEAEEVFCAAMGSISEKDPDREAIQAALRDAFKEWKESEAYNKLPETKKEAEEMRENGMVLYTVNGSGYQETYLEKEEVKSFAVNG